MNFPATKKLATAFFLTLTLAPTSWATPQYAQQPVLICQIFDHGEAYKYVQKGAKTNALGLSEEFMIGTLAREAESSKDWKKAEELYKIQLAVLKKFYELTDPILIGPLDNLVEVCKSQGKATEAAQYQKQIDQILAFGRAHVVARPGVVGLPLKECPPSSAQGMESDFTSRGDVFKSKGDTKTAVLYYQKAAAHNEPQYLQKLADAELDLKDYAKAEAAYKRLDAIDKKSQPEDEGKRMQDMFGLACSAAGLKKSREARQLFITIINSDSKLGVVLTLQPKAHLEYARLLVADGEIDQAREEYKKIIDNGNGYYMDYRKGAKEELAALH